MNDESSGGFAAAFEVYGGGDPRAMRHLDRAVKLALERRKWLDEDVERLLMRKFQVLLMRLLGASKRRISRISLSAHRSFPQPTASSLSGSVASLPFVAWKNSSGVISALRRLEFMTWGKL